MKKIADTLKRIFIRKRTLILLLALVGEICLKIAQKNSYFAEVIFGRHIFRWLSLGISGITRLFPFSVAEVMIILAPFAVIALIAGFIVKAVRNRKDIFYRIMTFVLNAACMASVVWFFYCFGCGINYYRYPVGDHFGYETEDASKEELAALLEELSVQTAEARKQVTSFDENGVYVIPDSPRALAKKAKEAYKKFSSKDPFFSGAYPAPKCIMLSHLMSYTEFTGIYTCWTMEANVNVDNPGYSLGSTMCHELAHLQGFIREDEANFISYMVCTASDDPDLRYSGLMLAFVYTHNALMGEDPELCMKAEAACADSGMWLDFVANSEYWKQFEKAKVIAEVADNLNDTYLKANDQEDGVKSYGRVVDLLIAKYRKEHHLE